MEDKVNNCIRQLAKDVSSLVNDLGTFGCMDEEELIKTPEDRIKEVYQWLTNPKGCKEASEYFKELLAILENTDAEYQRISNICVRIHKIQEIEPWSDNPSIKNTSKCR